MPRDRYLIAYDIRDDRRLRQVLELMKGTGTRLQYSVFLCDLSERELLRWRRDISYLIEEDEDSVVYINLGPPHDYLISVLGVPRQFPSERPQIL